MNMSSNSRGSEYRGVCKSGKDYQVLMKINNAKRYIGTFTDGCEAAKVFDLVSVIINGLKVSEHII